MRLAALASLLLHGAIIGLLLFELPRTLPEPDEPPGLEVMLGAVQAPAQGQVAAAPPLPPVEEPPAPQAEIPPPSSTQPLAAVPEAETVAALPTPPPAEPAPPPLPMAPEPPQVADLPPPPPPPPPPPASPRRAAVSAPAAPAPRAPPAPPEQPVTRPLFRDSLAELVPGAPGTSTEGELIPAREVPGIRNPLPIYPEAARQRGQQGSVGVRLRIDADGTVLRVEIVESSGHALLDQAVVEALRRWRFAPAMQGGRPVAADFLHRTTFRLD